jgi:hypothetical protein
MFYLVSNATPQLKLQDEIKVIKQSKCEAEVLLSYYKSNSVVQLVVYYSVSSYCISHMLIAMLRLLQNLASYGYPAAKVIFDIDL